MLKRQDMSSKCEEMKAASKQNMQAAKDLVPQVVRSVVSAEELISPARIASEILSATLSGCPSVTDFDVRILAHS